MDTQIKKQKIINVGKDGNVRVKYRGKNKMFKGGFEYSLSDYMFKCHNGEFIVVGAEQLRHLVKPYVMHYKQKKVGWFYDYIIFNYKILSKIASIRYHLE